MEIIGLSAFQWDAIFLLIYAAILGVAVCWLYRNRHLNHSVFVIYHQVKEKYIAWK